MADTPPIQPGSMLVMPNGQLAIATRPPSHTDARALDASPEEPKTPVLALVEFRDLLGRPRGGPRPADRR